MTTQFNRRIGIAAGIIKRVSHVPAGLGELVDHITFGSFTLDPREGNKEPNYWYDSEARTSYNAIGLTNMGLRAFILDELIGKRDEFLKLKAQGCKIRISLAPLKSGDLIKMAALMNEYWAQIGDLIAEVEVNAACPNHRDESGSLHPVLARDPEALKVLMREGKDLLCPKAIKIAPDTDRGCLRTCVNLAIELGYSTIVSANTRLTDTPRDSHSNLRLSMPKCGKGGAPLLEGAVAQVRMLCEMIRETDTPFPKPQVIGCGAVMCGADAQRHIDVGAVIAQTATYYMELQAKGIRDLIIEMK
jgi:dihydroorotate dehydrogenase